MSKITKFWVCIWCYTSHIFDGKAGKYKCSECDKINTVTER